MTPVMRPEAKPSTESGIDGLGSCALTSKVKV